MAEGPVSSGAGGPVSDLSYRGYGAGLRPGASRWSVIARQSIRATFKKKSFWVLTILSGAHYLVFIAVSYFIDSFAGNFGGADVAGEFFGRVVWRDQFLFGFQWGHFLLMAITLLVGAGAVANDNRSNALLVYLSKPCTKRDYLVGKWVGIFVPVLMAILLPAAFFFLYGVLNFREFGFLSDDGWMGLKVLLAAVLAAGFHSSLMLGVSSLFQQGRLAGAAYAGAYVLTGLFAGMAQVIGRQQEVPSMVRSLLDQVHYLSIYGGLEGIYKVVLQTDGSFFMRDRGAELLIPRPEGWLLFLVTVVPVLVLLGAAYRRVRAVEVVG